MLLGTFFLSFFNRYPLLEKYVLISSVSNGLSGLSTVSLSIEYFCLHVKSQHIIVYKPQ